MSKAVESLFQHSLCFRRESLELVPQQNFQDLVRHVNSRECLVLRILDAGTPGKFH